MLCLDNITIGYENRVLLKNVSAKIGDGRLAALIGRNGTGKSTLLRALCGLGRPLGGRISINGKDIADADKSETAKTIAFVGTDKVRIPNLKCEDLVALGRAPYTNWIGRIDGVDRKIIARALEAVGMSDYAGRTMDKMSDGECQRVMIARALAQDTPVMLLDEPTAFLDLPGRYHTVALLRDLAHESGKTIVFSTHDLDIALDEADDIMLMDTPDLVVGPGKEIGPVAGKVFGLRKYYGSGDGRTIRTASS